MWLPEVMVAVLTTALAAGAPGAPLGLEEAAERARVNDAEVRAAAAEVRAARGRLAGASAFLGANPELSGELGSRDAGADGRELDYEVGLSQRLELGGRRGAERDSARAALAAAEARLADAEARATAALRVKLGGAAAAGLRLALAEEGLQLAERAAAGAERRFAAGDAARVEVSGARLERGRAARAALEAAQELASARAELELLLGVEPGALPAIAFDLEAGAQGPERAVEPAAAAGAAAALARRRDVAAARLEVEAAAAGERAARRAWVTAPELGVAWGREEDARLLRGTLSFELPVFARGQAERAEASARAALARGELAAVERRAAQELRLAAGRLEAARRAVATFDAATMAALGEELAAATRAYEAGRIDLARWLFLRREALEARRERIGALEALNAAEAELARVSGPRG